jgi:hypothetical protein
VLLRPYCPRKSRKSSLLFFLVFTSIFITSAYGEETFVKAEVGKPREKIGSFDLENGFERTSFYTRYQIGGKMITRQGAGITHFPISELKFPMDAFMFYLNLNLNIYDLLTVHFNVKKNMHNYVGKMKDSDWVPYPGFRTVYSESDARLNGVFTEVDIIARFFSISFFSLKVGAGFMHQYLYYWCSNTKQTSIYTDTPPYIGSPQYMVISGKAITYEVQYYISTLQITPVFNIWGRLEIMLSFRFSPYLKARDIDDHILRAKKSKSDAGGSGFMPYLKIRYLFANRVFITTKLEYINIKTRGKQTQSYYLPVKEAGYIPGWYARLDVRHKSEQLNISIGAGYSFEF